MRIWIKLNDTDEYDVKFGSWKLYDILYRSNGFVPDGIDFEEDVNKDGRRRFISKRVCHSAKEMVIDLSGETDFNFGRKKIFGWGKSRMQYFKYYLKYVPKEEREIYSKLLSICEKHFYSPLNISLLPKTGGLNLVKKAIGNDRIDTFIWALDEWYKGGACLLLNCSSNENIASVKEYLGLFKNVYDYCNTIYFIEDALVRDLISSGTKPIDSYQRAKEYMILATRFWKQKREVISRLVK